MELFSIRIQRTFQLVSTLYIHILFIYSVFSLFFFPNVLYQKTIGTKTQLFKIRFF
jgi:competence protein ComGC